MLDDGCSVFTYVQLMTSVPGGGAMLDATILMVESEIRMSVRRASTLSSAPWMRAVPFLRRRFLLWLIVAVVKVNL